MLDDVFFAAEMDAHIKVIDLHEFSTIFEALEQLEKKLFLFSQNGERAVRVVHGIGSGRLAFEVHASFEKNPLIRSWKESEHGGSCIVIF